MTTKPNYSFPLLKSPAQTLQYWAVELRKRLNPRLTREWVPFTPEFVNGTMTTALDAVGVCEYKITEDGFAELRFFMKVINSGVASDVISLKSPFPNASFNLIHGMIDDGSNVSGWLSGDENILSIKKVSLSNFALTSVSLWFSGRMKILGEI